MRIGVSFMDELAKARRITKEDRIWLDEHIYELQEIWKILGEKDRLVRFITRALDYLNLYTDLDVAGDWTLVRQVVLCEIKLDDLQRQFQEMDLETITRSRMASEMKKIQDMITDALKILGTGRGVRRKEKQDQVKFLFGLDAEKIIELRDTLREERQKREKKFLES